jgi:hypothetical protein
MPLAKRKHKPYNRRKAKWGEFMDDMIRRVHVKFGDEAPSAPPLPTKINVRSTPTVTPKTTINVRDAGSGAQEPIRLRSAAGANFKPLTSIRPTLQPVPQEPKGPETIDEPDDLAADDTDDAPTPEIKKLPPDEPPKPPRRNPFGRFFGGYWRHKLWALPLTLLVIIGAAAAVPQSRYPVLALFMTRQFVITVTDSTTGTPVTGAEVTMDGMTTQTGSTGKAYVTAKVGKREVTVSKKYYQDATEAVFVGVATGAGRNAATVTLAATGRQVPVSVTDKITGKALSNVAIRVLDTEARTDTNGQATIVLPTTADTQAATLSADGYATLTTTITVTSDAVDANKFALVPSGRIFFLSNQSGNIDVVSTNLDGTGRKTILAGTGSEDQNGTVLLASRDWQYLALLSKRDGGSAAKLYLINTGNGNLTTIDDSNAVFTLVGWSDHTFVYQASDSDKELWQSGKTTVKSYNAEKGTLTTIAQTTAQGDSSSYTEQNLGFVDLINDRVVYGFAWNTPQTGPQLGANKNSIYSANVDGTNKKDLRDITPPAGTTYSGMYAVLVSPTELYIQSSMESQPDVYYSYKYQNNSVTQSDTITDSTFTQAQQSNVTYLESPSGNATFWSQTRDGKNTLFVGDYAGLNGNQIASASIYAPYGWYTDKYLLVQKGGSELYVMPVAGGTPLKISDYYKPQYTFYGYGGGYGGL